jgi:3-oxoacyl-[acyl-carrier-protein] synthase II
MSREIQAGFAAAVLALGEAGLAGHPFDPDRLGVVYGCEVLYCEIGELEEVYRNCTTDHVFHFDRWGKRAMSDMFPLFMLKYLPNMVACHIAIAHDARGPNNTISVGDASSLLAVIEAARIMERGHADVMIAGGAGSRLSLTPLVYRRDLGLSHRNEDPQAASRPFDARRDGMVNGEGAGALILETLEYARARGARILAEIAGCGTAYANPSHQPPKGRGIRQAIARALEEAQLTPEAVDHVNAHGLSTVEEDAVEAQAIRAMLGNTPVTAPKSYFGNLGTGGAAVELAASLDAWVHGTVPPTLNYEQPDPQCPVTVVHGDARQTEREAALILSQSSTGQSAAIVLAAPPG